MRPTVAQSRRMSRETTVFGVSRQKLGRGARLFMERGETKRVRECPIRGRAPTHPVSRLRGEEIGGPETGLAVTLRQSPEMGMRGEGDLVEAPAHELVEGGSGALDEAAGDGQLRGRARALLDLLADRLLCPPVAAGRDAGEHSRDRGRSARRLRRRLDRRTLPRLTRALVEYVPLSEPSHESPLEAAPVPLYLPVVNPGHRGGK